MGSAGTSLENKRFILKITMTYTVMGALWVLFSDRAASALAGSAEDFRRFALVKDWAYVALASLLLYGLLNWKRRAGAQVRETLPAAWDAPCIMLRVDREGGITGSNEFAREFFGYSAEEMLDPGVAGSILPGGDGQTCGRSRAESVRRDGARARIAWAYAPVPDECGLVKEMQYIGHDITEYCGLAEAARQSEAHHRSLFENMLNAHAYCRMVFEGETPKDYVYLEVNRAFETLTGLKNVTGKRASEVIPGFAENDRELLSAYANVVRTGEPSRFEAYVRGLGLWLSCSVYRPREGHFVSLFDVITERKKAEEALRTSLQEKVALLQEVHHRVKNNLQIVASLLNLQAGRAVNRHAVEILHNTRDRVRSMALLHEVLYRSRNLARINFPDYVDDLCSHLLRSFGQTGKRINLEKRIAPIMLPLEHSVPCGLIINELVSNSLKHAFPGDRGGTVTVELAPSGVAGQLGLRVSDDGVGPPPGMDVAVGSTLGLQLVSSLAGQLGGHLKMESPAGGGVAFTMFFPVPQDSEIEVDK